MRIFLLSLTILFASSLLACVLVAVNAGAWRSDAVPHLPSKLWVSTLVLLGVSVALECGRQFIRQNRQRWLQYMLILTTILALGFLVSQTRVWLTLADINLPSTSAKSLYAFSFAVLTGLHALHVIGGFIPLGWCLLGAYEGRYTNYNYTGITYCAMYWHFLDTVWLVIVSTILLL
jgi:cytochrome c oxidase subunit 3